MTEVKARNRYLRMSPRKVRLVVDAVRGMDVEPAVAQLRFMTKAAARPVRKLIESAVANAVNNNKLSKEGLYIKTIAVDQGPTLKRWRPRAMGSSARILKRTSHVTVVLGTKEESKEKKVVKETKKGAEKTPAVKVVKTTVKAAPKKPVTKKPAVKAPAKKKPAVAKKK